jgi:hypothetical protein
MPNATGPNQMITFLGQGRGGFGGFARSVKRVSLQLSDTEKQRRLVEIRLAIIVCTRTKTTLRESVSPDALTLQEQRSFAAVTIADGFAVPSKTDGLGFTLVDEA